MKKTTLVLIIAAAALTAASCGKKEHHKQAAADARPPIRVEVVTVGASESEGVWSVAGTVKSVMRAVLSPKVMGPVTAVYVDEGDRVKKGQILAKIDARDIAAQAGQARAGVVEAKQALAEVDLGIEAARAGYDAAAANRDLAEKTYQRFVNLREEKSVSQMEFDKVEAQMKMATADAVRAGKMLESMESKRNQVLAKIEQARQGVAQVDVYQGYAVVRAPFDGVVVSRTAEPGQLSAPGAPLLIVEGGGGFRFEAQVDEKRLAAVKLGGEATVILDSAKGSPLKGKVVEINPAVDPSSRTVSVEISLPESPVVGSGMFGRAEFSDGTKKILAVPKSAIARRGQLEGFFVVEKGRARFRLAKTGREFADGTVELLSGAGPGEKIAVSGVDRLEDGRTVEVDEK